MTPEQVAALAADATPGPWAEGNRYTMSGVYTANGETLVATTHGSQRNDDRDKQIAEQDGNRAFIAAAHNMADLIARMDEALRAADALALLVNNAIRDGCPACGGDCASANPPVVLCPQQVREAALAAYRATRENLK